MNPRINLLALGNALAACCLFGCNQSAPGPTEPAPRIAGEVITFTADSPQLKSIRTIKVEAPRERELQIPGRLVWDEERTVRVFTPFAGRVTRIGANVGDKVNAGQRLAELASPDFGQAQADVRKAQADLAAKSAHWKRMQELAAAGVAAAKDLQQAEADQRGADAEFRRASARLSQFGGSDNVDQQFPLMSPITGVIVEKNINLGQELRPDQPGAAQFVVTDPSKLWVQLDSNESDLQSLRVGTLLVLSSSSYPGETFAGELRQVADYVDPVSRTLKLRGTVRNADRRLKAELFVNARIMLPRNEYPTVAEKAIFLDGLRRFVFVKTAAGTFSRRGVRVGPSYGDVLPVLAGLKQGDEVVVSGGLNLQQMLASTGMSTDAPDVSKNAPDDAPPAKPSPDSKK